MDKSNELDKSIYEACDFDDSGIAALVAMFVGFTDIQYLQQLLLAASAYRGDNIGTPNHISFYIPREEQIQCFRKKYGNNPVVKSRWGAYNLYEYVINILPALLSNEEPKNKEQIEEIHYAIIRKTYPPINKPGTFGYGKTLKPVCINPVNCNSCGIPSICGCVVNCRQMNSVPSTSDGKTVFDCENCSRGDPLGARIQTLRMVDDADF